MKGLIVAFALGASLAGHAATISIVGAHPCDAAGNPLAPTLGESFFVSAQLEVDGAVSGPYSITLRTASGERQTCDVSFGGHATLVWGPFTALLPEDAIEVSANPGQNQSEGPRSFGYQAQVPTRGIEAFAPGMQFGSLGAKAALLSGPASSLKWWLPVPTSGAFQSILTLARPSGSTQIATMPFAQPVAVASGANPQLTFSARCSSSRINPALLRKATWSVPSSVAAYLQPEYYVESRNAEVVAFARRVLPTNYLKATNPYDAAEALFKATVGRIAYTPMTSATPSALIALRSGKGDCGYFASLFVASCRAVGIPARTVVGQVHGASEWHVWAEFYLNGYGWIPADPSYADALSPDGARPVYFGTVPDLSQRLAFTYGFDHLGGGYRLGMLQSPALVALGSAKVSGFQPYCSLSEDLTP